MAPRSSLNCARCAKGDCHPSIKAGKSPPMDKLFARQASIQEFEGYERLPDGLKPKNPRILELIQFAQKCGYKKLGLAFCVGLLNEASTLADILEGNGFEVVSVCCKVGAIPKERIGLKPEQKIGGAENWESMCNPIAQAEILNSERVDLAVMLGLCIGHDTLFIRYCRRPMTVIGHDTLFIRYCRRPMTVIAVKDRVTGHNPLAALYTSSTYYAYLMGKGKKKPSAPF